MLQKVPRFFHQIKENHKKYKLDKERKRLIPLEVYDLFKKAASCAFVTLENLSAGRTIHDRYGHIEDDICIDLSYIHTDGEKLELKIYLIKENVRHILVCNHTCERAEFESPAEWIHDGSWIDMVRAILSRLQERLDEIERIKRSAFRRELEIYDTKYQNPSLMK